MGEYQTVEAHLHLSKASAWILTNLDINGYPTMQAERERRARTESSPF